MYDLFFDLNDNLCQRYPALTPFMVRRERFGEVTKLLQRVNGKVMRSKGISAGDRVWRDSNGDTHIRRRATNDNWY